MSAAPAVETPAAGVFVVRRMTARDTAFVVDSWMRSAWHVEERKLIEALKARRAPWSHREREKRRAKRSFMVALRPHVEALMRAGEVLIACDREAPDNLAGWVAVLEGRELRSYIKHDYRGWGVEALLVQGMGAL